MHYRSAIRVLFGKISGYMGYHILRKNAIPQKINPAKNQNCEWKKKGINSFQKDKTKGVSSGTRERIPMLVCGAASPALPPNV